MAKAKDVLAQLYGQFQERLGTGQQKGMAMGESFTKREWEKEKGFS